jgi:hypothetical protein
MNEPTELPHIDAHSPCGHLRVTRTYLEQRFGKQESRILRGAFIGNSPTRKIYWFRDTPEVRRELGMEEK